MTPMLRALRQRLRQIDFFDVILAVVVIAVILMLTFELWEPHPLH